MQAFGKIRLQGRGGGAHVEACAERIDAEVAQFGEFIAAHGDEFGFGGLVGLRGDGVAHGKAAFRRIAPWKQARL